MKREKLHFLRRAVRAAACILSLVFLLILGGAAGSGFSCALMDRLLPGQPVWAASSASSVEKIPFTDKSGSYLKYKKGKFYLYDKKGVPQKGVQYLKIRKTRGIFTGYYMFSDKGVLLQKRTVHYIKNKKVAGTVFNGYYLADKNGRFINGTPGLRYLPGYSCNHINFEGYFYAEKHGKLTRTAGVQYLKAVKVNGKKFAAGYYYFSRYGKLKTGAAFHQVKGRTNGRYFNGTYYFGGKDGALYAKKGWLRLKSGDYYLSATGKRYENRWLGGYYFLSDGKMARSMRVPDGSYVDCDGRKCAKQEMALSSLKKQLQQMIASYPGTWSVYVKNLKTGDVVNINDVSMYPASTIKAFVMASTFDQIKQKKLSYSFAVKSLLNSMITVSDNESYNQLVRYNSPSRSFVDGAAVVNKYLKKNGYTNTECHSSLHPAYSSPVSDGGRNKASAKDCGLLLERIYKGKCVSSAYSREMLNLLLKQTRRWKIPAGLPAGTKAANKTGETSSYQHDIAIVYGPKTTYVLCIFSTVSEYYGISGIKNITRTVHSCLN